MTIAEKWGQEAYEHVNAQDTIQNEGTWRKLQVISREQGLTMLFSTNLMCTQRYNSMEFWIYNSIPKETKIDLDGRKKVDVEAPTKGFSIYRTEINRIVKL